MIEIASMDLAIAQARHIRSDIEKSPRIGEDLSKRMHWKVLVRACLVDTRYSINRIDNWRSQEMTGCFEFVDGPSQAPEIFSVVTEMLAPNGVDWSGRQRFASKEERYNYPDVRWALRSIYGYTMFEPVLVLWPVDKETAWNEREMLAKKKLAKTGSGDLARRLVEYLIGVDFIYSFSHDFDGQPIDRGIYLPENQIEKASSLKDCLATHWTHISGPRSGRKLISELKKII